MKANLAKKIEVLRDEKKEEIERCKQAMLRRLSQFQIFAGEISLHLLEGVPPQKVRVDLDKLRDLLREARANAERSNRCEDEIASLNRLFME